MKDTLRKGQALTSIIIELVYSYLTSKKWRSLKCGDSSYCSGY